MAEETSQTPSISSESSAAPTKPMRSLPRRVFKYIYNGFRSCWENNNSNQSPRNRTTFHRDVEQEDLQCAGGHCLSSYYSVFVARLAMMVMLAILIGLLTLLTWHFTRVYTKKSLDTLAYGLRYELLQRPILRMWNIFNTTIEITTAQVKMSEFVMKKYSNPVNQEQQVELYQVMRDMTWALFTSHKALNSITINYRNGFVQAFHRDHKSNNTFYIYSDLVNYSISGTYNINMLLSRPGWNDQSVHNNISAIWYREPLDPITGEKIGKSRAILPDDLIYIAGISQVPDGAASWHVAVSKYSDSPLLSAALPVLDSSKEGIVAVVGVTTALYSVGQLMKELVEFHSGHIYLTSQEGWLLATSTNTPLLKNSTTGPTLMMAADSEEHVIRSGANLLKETYGNLTPSNHSVHIENARLGNQLYYIDTFFLNLKRLPMVGVIIIPRRYIMGKVDERAIKTLVILISASLCILVTGCVCIFILTNGVSKEMKLRAELISHLDARRKAEASSNYKSQFLANMSHELRTPMAAVIGLLDILMCDDCLTNEQYSTITQIRRCSTALLRLLNNILDLSKVESGKLVLEVAEFDLGRELEGLVDMFSVQCINHNVETVLDLSDDIPRLVQGDSGRVVQIFANLISNSIKFTTSGYIVLRGWCESPNMLITTRKCSFDHEKDPRSTPKTKFKLQRRHDKRFCRKDKKIILYFEVEDTGCGIDPRKWDSVFESFEQADPSTTRLHGGTGLGLCIVRTLVNQMGGDIRVIKKNGPGTLMQLNLLLSTPEDETRECNSFNFEQHDLVVLLALGGREGRLVMSRWLQTHGMHTYEASQWNELTQRLQELFQGGNNMKNSPERCSGAEDTEKRITIFIVVVDIRLLDLSTDRWKEQLCCLDNYSGRAKFAWILNHDTSNNIKMELRRKGHVMMVNRPLYKGKMIQIVESAIREFNFEKQENMNHSRSVVGDDMHESLEMNHIHPDTSSSSESDKLELMTSSSSNGLQLEENQQNHGSKPCLSRNEAVNNCFVELTEVHTEEDELSRNEKRTSRTCSNNPSGGMYPTRITDGHNSLEGIRILLAEDTPLLQKVATIMLEKLGAAVVVVGDGLQAVDALKIMPSPEEWPDQASSPEDGSNDSQAKGCGHSAYDLILMDCQMPKMDGYEATKAIRRLELGTSSHIPIVALTAHAMSSDEAKCLEVGMDAYLTKPIDRKLMVSTILSLTRTTA